MLSQLPQLVKRMSDETGPTDSTVLELMQQLDELNRMTMQAQAGRRRQMLTKLSSSDAQFSEGEPLAFNMQLEQLNQLASLSPQLKTRTQDSSLLEFETRKGNTGEESDPGVVDFGPSGDLQNQWKEGKYNDLKSVPVEEREEMYQELRQLLDRREILREKLRILEERSKLKKKLKELEREKLESERNEREAQERESEKSNMLQSLGHAELNAGPVIECDVGFNVQDENMLATKRQFNTLPDTDAVKLQPHASPSQPRGSKTKSGIAALLKGIIPGSNSKLDSSPSARAGSPNRSAGLVSSASPALATKVATQVSGATAATATRRSPNVQLPRSASPPAPTPPFPPPEGMGSHTPAGAYMPATKYQNAEDMQASDIGWAAGSSAAASSQGWIAPVGSGIVAPPPLASSPAAAHFVPATLELEVEALARQLIELENISSMASSSTRIGEIQSLATRIQSPQPEVDNDMESKLIAQLAMLDSLTTRKSVA